MPEKKAKSLCSELEKIAEKFSLDIDGMNLSGDNAFEAVDEVMQLSLVFEFEFEFLDSLILIK